MGAIKGGAPLNTDASSWLSGSAAVAVSGLSVSASDYTSAKFSWNAASNALGYYVYLGNSVIASVLSLITIITIGGLQPGASHAFHKTITNYHFSPGADLTTLQADILVPYAFVRLYIWNSVECEFEPIWDRVSNSKSMSISAPTSWSRALRYTNTVAHFPKALQPHRGRGTSTIDTSKFVIQAQGYNPLTNVFEPDPSAYDCKGSSINETGINQSGNCWGDHTRGCGVFIQGDASCSISGNDLWNDLQNIRKIGGCSKCGSFHREDGCLITINYVYQCDNHG
ncbi:hypothetical protein ETB97_010935 [Aspergillus alliaceus]|uniref:Uncharacterized protein n=1 Tax=Petromyces alliaceus TaxID=209559 RepID=A0A8H5ZV59_PETAA|nr:hypothetical protein ETB97_010935 [Aspergillus burnettii]